MSDRVTIEITDGVADVRMNRPDKLNALDAAMFEALVESGRELKAHPGVRAVVLSGEGRAFSAGLDFASFQAIGDDAPDLFSRDGSSAANYAQRAAHIWHELPMPVLAAVHGVAYGAGFQIAMASDIRFVAPDARFSVMEIKWGLIPDMGGTQTLRHLVRADVAKELTFTGRVVSGEEAGVLGLASHVDAAPRERAFDMAFEIASKSPDAVRAGKRLFNEGWDGSEAAGLRLEEDIQRTLLGGANQKEAVKANFENRAPAFRDPEHD